MPEFEFDRIRKHRYAIWLNRNYKTALLSLGIERPREFRERFQVGVIDDVTRSKIVSTEVPALNESMRLAVKTYHPRGLAAAFKDMLRASRAVREFLFAGRLYSSGIPVPEPVAALERRSYRRVKECWFVSREIVGAKSGYVLIAGEKTYGKWPQVVRSQFVTRLGRAIGDAHARGYAHGDLNMSHLIVSPVKPNQWPTLGPHVHFVDFEGGSLLKNKPPRPLRMRDLMRFMRSFRKFASASECAAFFKAYAAAAGENEAAAKEYFDEASSKLGPLGKEAAGK